MPESPSRQSQIVNAVFSDAYSPGMTSVPFSRSDRFAVCHKHNIVPLADMGDGAIYSYRYRTKLPDEIYVGIDRNGRHFAIPVQAKVDSDKIGSAQLFPGSRILSTAIPDCDLPATLGEVR